MIVNGPTGRLLIGGRLAAEIGKWQAESEGRTISVHARLRRVDEFWIDAAGPVVLELPFGDRTIRYSDAAIPDRNETHIYIEARREHHA